MPAQPTRSYSQTYTYIPKSILQNIEFKIIFPYFKNTAVSSLYGIDINEMSKNLDLDIIPLDWEQNPVIIDIYKIFSNLKNIPGKSLNL